VKHAAKLHSNLLGVCSVAIGIDSFESGSVWIGHTDTGVHTFNYQVGKCRESDP
jgi:hypothetical protein